MNNVHWLLKAFKTIGFVLILGASLTACGAGSEKWKEEVQLSDGKVIVIERELLMANGGDELAVDNRSNFSPKEYHIQLSDPNDPSKTIKWHSIKKDTSTFPESPLILDILSGQVTIYTSLAVGAGCQMYSKYLYKDGAWIEEKLPPAFEQRVTNLFVYRGKDVQRFVDLKTKQEIVSKHYSADRSDRFDLVGPEHPNCKGV